MPLKALMTMGLNAAPFSSHCDQFLSDLGGIWSCHTLAGMPARCRDGSFVSCRIDDCQIVNQIVAIYCELDQHVTAKLISFIKPPEKELND